MSRMPPMPSQRCALPLCFHIGIVVDVIVVISVVVVVVVVDVVVVVVVVVPVVVVSKCVHPSRIVVEVVVAIVVVTSTSSSSIIISRSLDGVDEQSSVEAATNLPRSFSNFNLRASFPHQSKMCSAKIANFSTNFSVFRILKKSIFSQSTRLVWNT